MKNKREKGMTVLEVVIALSILMIGIGFLMQSDAVSYHYRDQREQRQQMLFYAAGQMEAFVQGQTVSGDHAPFSNYTVQTTVTPVTGSSHLEKVQLTVSSKSVSSYAPLPVELYGYRVTP
ncbi:type IV pilus modification PilV family protein [Desulfosporosinus metallidurans]|uniref:SOS-response transcriptional repressors (RecA-mediated autopeptidases) n=1 Tax=Desulfosporosinus metallidurans TaxID=1888891 RepID=A0A1Q8QY42_9FIRM|nr:type II secretion system protein [Desulfosporosinus metallidurans]OLN32236.1 SOS-response transcriptional repressors (RecA-mediated autopeptidases) [Desulfosporosinus metallidurans]